MGFHRGFGCLILILVVLAMTPTTSTADGDDNISPVLAPYYDNICNEVKCGRGRCEASRDSKFGFTCQCENGWRRTRLDQDDDNDDEEDDLRFLPCVIPNCRLDYGCLPAAPPTPAAPYNISAFDPCYWTYCGGGTCSKDRTYTYTCQCDRGFSNLFDVSIFPCLSQCALDSDCERLGIRVSNSSSSSWDGSQATSFLPGKFLWIPILFISGVMIMWK